MAVVVISPEGGLFEAFDTCEEAMDYYYNLAQKEPKLPLTVVDYHDPDSEENGTILATRNMR